MTTVDYDALKETGSGGRFERLTALLIGLVAIVAAVLVVIQTTASLDEARNNAVARRLASELTTRLIAGSSLASYGGIHGQRALMVTMEGNSRALVALGTGNAGQQAIGDAETVAGNRLTSIALAMGATPDEDSPLDPYARAMLASIQEELFAILERQNAAADAAVIASDRSSRAVMGLSLIALAGVMAGLAAVVGPGRAGRALLLLGWTCAFGAIGLLAVARGLIAI
jgi:hypothetical protein